MRYARFVSKGVSALVRVNQWYSVRERSHNKQRKVIIEIIRWLLLSTEYQQQQQKTNDIISRSLMHTHTHTLALCHVADGDDTIQYDTTDYSIRIDLFRWPAVRRFYLNHVFLTYPSIHTSSAAAAAAVTAIGFHISYNSLMRAL